MLCAFAYYFSKRPTMWRHVPIQIFALSYIIYILYWNITLLSDWSFRFYWLTSLDAIIFLYLPTILVCGTYHLMFKLKFHKLQESQGGGEA